MTEARRVVITGIGTVTPIGTGVDGFWEGLRAMRSRVGTVTRFDPEPFRTKIAAEVRDFRPQDFLEERRVKRLDRCSQFTLAAARLALADSALDLAKEDRERVGAMMGSALGGVSHAEAQHANYLSGGIRAVDPGLALTVFTGAASCNLAIEIGLQGPNSTNGMSFRAIRRGEADVMLAGGAEAPLAPLTFGAFSIIRAMSTRNDDPAEASRPFDSGRDGFVMAEGAAVLVLETRERALARGARIYAEIAGYGTTNDAHHMTAPRPDGTQAARAVRLALADAAITPGEVGYVNAHGSATPLNDPTETLALRLAFGDHASRLTLSGTKGYYGHALGASGAFEAAICALASARRWLPPTVNLAAPDPSCDLRYLQGEGLEADPEHLVSTSFGFGGINAALVFRRASA
ncbi:MAG: beta-ketoacyl-ACP synthase II [Gemmatimonadetes bacterium]|nr:beta-ketoacyl-ACP synthase II [Gemmatimonadota bacterium]